MKFKINQDVYFIVSLSGKILIQQMLISKSFIVKSSNEIYYSGYIYIDGSETENFETVRENRLFATRNDALQEIYTQLIALRG